MAIYKRADLKAQGLTDEQIDWIMTEGNRRLAKDYTLNSDIQAQIDAAVASARADHDAPAVTESEEYRALAQERDMLRAIGGEDFAGVKPKFREAVFGMLDRSEDADPVADQLKAIAGKYEEYFAAELQPEPKKPTFGAPTQGSVPSGKTGPSFMDAWGFIPPGK